MADIKFDLSGVKSYEDTPFRRPRIYLDVERNCYHDWCKIMLTMCEQMGQPQRSIEMTADETRQLAAHLLVIADLSEHEPQPEELEHAFEDSGE
jgi:hypothetical protein